MIIHILAGGPVELLPDLSCFADNKITWIGVDRGVYTLLEKGIKPDFAFGDFDSVSEEELQKVEEKVANLFRFYPEKDETDIELALDWALKQKPEKIRIFGATGGRLDHMFGNLQLLIGAIQKNITIDIEIIYVKAPGTYNIERSNEKKYISFIPITSEVKGLTLKGFKYPLKDRHIPLGSTLCISNEILIDNGTFSFSDGILMVVRSTD